MVSLAGALKTFRHEPIKGKDRSLMVRFGLLGCGHIAKRHSELLGGGIVEGARLVAVCDSDRARADAIAAKFKVSAYADHNEMLARDDIDAVAVLTPSGRHGGVW
ncbi:putative dehydrogenase [Bradyrhizobium sp. LB8.2]|uniref:Gfo/Idh/MocA family oxidoreductase n=1 Tax=unclassified Bradyrhizobium TaxID=2631580 RepID=UPI00339B3094